MSFKFFSLMQVQIQLFLCDDVFYICDDVRSEYMSTHVRIDSSRFVGFLPS